MKLGEVITQRQLTEEDTTNADEIAKRFLANLPHNGDNLDYLGIGKLLGDACFGVGGVEATDSARAVFKTALVQSLYGKVNDSLSSSPLGSIVQGLFSSKAVSDQVAALITGFMS